MNLYEIEINKDEGFEKLVVVLNPNDRINIPSSAIVGRIERGENGRVEKFFENPDFLKILHRCVEINGPFSPTLQEEAAKQKNGIIFVVDGRVSDILGKILPEDIIGAFEVRGGQVHPETYRANSNHRIYSNKGFFQLDCYLEAALLKAIEKRIGNQ
jgi:hypothetical protein